MTNEEAIEVLRKIALDVPTGVIDPSDFYLSLALAIKALETGEVYMTGEDYNLYMEGYKAGKKDFEPKQGEWEMIGTIGLAYKCNKCGEVLVVPTNFCSNCGAKMKGGKEE